MTAVVVQENLDRIDELSMIVAGCTVLLFILSEGCLESPFCRQELTAAVAARREERARVGKQVDAVDL